MARIHNAYAGPRRVHARAAAADLGDAGFHRHASPHTRESPPRGGTIRSRIMALLCLLAMIVIWPLCAVWWLIEWAFVKFMTRGAKPSRPSYPR